MTTLAASLGDDLAGAQIDDAIAATENRLPTDPGRTAAAALAREAVAEHALPRLEHGLAVLEVTADELVVTSLHDALWSRLRPASACGRAPWSIGSTSPISHATDAFWSSGSASIASSRADVFGEALAALRLQHAVEPLEVILAQLRVQPRCTPRRQ